MTAVAVCEKVTIACCHQVASISVAPLPGASIHVASNGWHHQILFLSLYCRCPLLCPALVGLGVEALHFAWSLPCQENTIFDKGGILN